MKEEFFDVKGADIINMNKNIKHLLSKGKYLCVIFGCFIYHIKRIFFLVLIFLYIT